MLSYTRDHADIVIVGGGIMGAAVAYNLVRNGAKDVLLIDQHETGEGTTWHTPGFMGTVRITAAGDLLSQDSVALWDEMAARHGSEAGWYQTGGLRVARTEQRATELAAMAQQARELGTECEIGGRELVAAAHPGFWADDVLFAVYAPSEGWVDAFAMTRTLVKEAQLLGLRVMEGTKVTGFERSSDRVVGLNTWRGFVACGEVILAAGCVSKAMAAEVGVDLPVHNFLARATVLTAPIDFPKEFPAVRDNDGMSYFRPDPEGVLVGGDLARPEPTDNPDPLGTPRINVPTEVASMRGQIEAAARRYPALLYSEVLKVIRGPEAFSADGECILGQSGVEGLTLATAGSGHGVAFAGGIGKAIAQTVLTNASDRDISPYKLSRFDGQNLTPADVIRRAESEYVNYLTIRPWLVDSAAQ